MSIKALREERGALYASAQNMVDNWKPESKPEFDAINAKIDAIDEQINATENHIQKAAKDYIAKELDNTLGKGDAENVLNIYVKYLRGGKGALNQMELASLTNAQSAGVGSEGGFTVPKILIPNVSEALKVFGGIRTVAQVITTDSGEQWDYPTNDATAQVGVIVAENTDVGTGSDLVYGTVPLAIYNWSSQPLAVSRNLLQDSATDVAAFVNKKLLERIARAHSSYFITGTGTAQPKGIVTAATSGKVGTTGQTVTVTYADLVDLEHSVDPAYRDRSVWVMHDSTFKALKKLVDGQNRPLLMSESMSVSGSFERSILGYPVVIVQEMPVMAANAKSIIFGDLSNYVVRDVNYVGVQYFEEMVFSVKNQVGFHALARMGATYTDVGASLKYYQNSAT